MQTGQVENIFGLHVTLIGFAPTVMLNVSMAVTSANVFTDCCIIIPPVYVEIKTLLVEHCCHKLMLTCRDQQKFNFSIVSIVTTSRLFTVSEAC